MRNKRLVRWLIGLVVLLGCGLGARPAQAATGAGFTMQMVPNSAQTTGQQGYFDLTVKPNQTGVLRFKLVNLTNGTLKLKVAANTGYTSANGIEAYDRHQLGTRSATRYQLKDLVKVPATVTLEPGATRLVTATYRMPAERFTGVLEGAFYVLNPATGDRQATDKRGFYIHNRYAMELGLVFREQTSVKVQPNLKLTRVSAQVDAANKFSPAVSAHLVNTRPQLLKHLTIDGRVSDANNQLLYKTKRTHLGMAPMSNFDYLINTSNQRLKPGRYQLRLVATAGKQRWVFERHFTISAKQAEHANRETPRNWQWLWWLLLILLILLALYGAYRFGRRQAKEKSN